MCTEQLKVAVEILKGDGLVAFPTETVYGLGADARSAKALERLFRVKGRPSDHPVIVHLGSTNWIPRWAISDERAVALAERFWPGPLTLILKKREGVLDQITGGQESVGVRMPFHPLALELLQAFGDGLAAPSANRFGRVSPTTAEHVRSDLGEAVDFILDGGPCQVGVESTIVDLTGPEIRILRLGAVTESHLREVFGEVSEGENPRVRAPGTLKSHYAPTTPADLVTTNDLRVRLEALKRRGLRVGVWSRLEPDPGSADFWLRAESDAATFARSLYQNLRLLDSLAFDRILVEEPPEREDFAAARDRLRRASHKG